MKKLILVLVACGGAYYFYKKRAAATSPKVPGSNATNIQPVQPSQSYPWSAIFPPRVDNQNQPYANGQKLSLPVDSYNLSGLAGAGSSVVHSLADVWSSLTGSAGVNSPSATLQSADSMPESDPTDDSVQLPGQNYDQTDLVGAASAGVVGASDNYAQYDYSNLIGSEYSADYSDTDSSYLDY